MQPTVEIAKKIVAFGSNRVYLPRFTIALIRTKGLSPYHAKFEVPLNFSKFDIRDYLYHAYNIKCFNIRSYVHLQPVRDAREEPRHWFRPDSKKYMTVEMEKPFVWPEAPENFEPWGQKDRRKQQKDAIESTAPPSKKKGTAAALRSQAEKMLKLKKSSESTWKKRRTGKVVEADAPKFRIKV